MMDAFSKNQSIQEDRSSRNSGSISGDRIKMLDITRDKPIKVAVRVAVPVRDHPKFNFVGKLLGPKGNSMKRLQEDTMCKMAVLGRGSMRDRKKEEELRLSGEPRYAHLSEDLHVEITTFAAPAEAHARIAYALSEVRRFLVPDYHDDIRQEQMWEMHTMSSSSSSSSQTQTGEQNSPNGSLAGATISGNGGSPPGGISNTNANVVVSESMSISMDVTESTPTSGTLPTASATTTATTLNTHTIHPSVAAVIQHQLATTGMGIIKPATGVAAVTGLTPTNQTTIGMPSEAETTTPTLALLEPPGALLHPALRGVKTVNIASGLTRKRPLLGVPRSGMNPTKRTVMTLLARAKSSQAVHAALRNSTPTAAAAAAAAAAAGHIPEYISRHHAIRIYPRPLQMITSPLILPQAMDESMIVQQKESLSQGV